MRNIRDAYKKNHLKFKPENEFQLKEDVDAVKVDLDTLEARIEQMKALVKATITFNSDGGSSVATQYVSFEGTVTEPEDPTKAGNRFDKWCKGTETTAYNFSTPVVEDFTLKAYWTAVYTVTYALDGGSGTTPTQSPCAEGETFTLASGEGIIKEGKTFGGWNDGTTTYEAGATYTMGSANVTLTAVWN